MQQTEMEEEETGGRKRKGRGCTRRWKRRRQEAGKERGEDATSGDGRAENGTT